MKPQSMNKRWSLVPLAVVACGTAPALARADTWALLVGVSKYQSTQIASLKYPSSDAAALRDALIDPNLGRLPKDHVLLLTDDQATRDNILSAVDTFLAKNVQAGDSIIISLAGHGVAKGVGLDAKSYFLGTDVRGASKEAMETSAVNLRTLCTSIGKLPASQFILFVDACREDPTPGRGLKPNSESDSLARSTRIVPENETGHANSVTFYACQVGQRAYEDADYKHGVFTYWILDAIKEAAGAAPPPDGRIEMGRLASYVRAKVKTWGEKAAIEQTPELTLNDPDARGSEPIYFVKVDRASTADVRPEPPMLAIDVEPDTAAVILNGTAIGSGPQSKQMREGDNTVRVEAPGYAPVEKTFRALPGYQYQLMATLNQGSAAPGSPPANGASQITVQFQKAQTLEAAERWTDAMDVYGRLMGQKYAPAYERLAGLQQRQGNSKGAIDTLVKLNQETPPSSHTYSLLARAYSTYALKETATAAPKADEGKKADDISVGGIKIRNPFGKRKKQEPRSVEVPGSTGDFRVPENGVTAAALAQKAADEADKANATSVDTYLARGYSLTSADSDGKNAEAAIAAFRAAVTAAPNEAATNYSLGFGQFFFSRYVKDKADRERQVQDAITALNRAIELRPHYYEALRTRAYCHHLLGHGTEARQDYDQAIANRGSAADPDEVAALNVAQSTLLREQSQGENGSRKTELANAADGYIVDAKDFAGVDLRGALGQLKRIGLGRRITDFLDAPLRDIYNKIPTSIPGFNVPINFPRPRF